MVRILLALLALMFAGGGATAQPDASMLVADPVPPVRGEQIPLAEGEVGDEAWNRVLGQIWVRNVERPSLYPVRPPEGRSSGKAVIVVPGGGYRFVSIESEGFRVAERLAAEGHTAFVLKYRPMATPAAPEAFMEQLKAQFGTLGRGALADHPPAVDDLAAAVDYVRNNAGELGVDVDAIGVIGFSAGSRTAIRLLEQREQAGALDHVALIYPPMTQVITGGPRPDLFLAIAVDDPLFVQGGLTLLENWLEESRAVEFHLYSGGDHGFGMRSLGTTSDRWIDAYLEWLAVQ